MFEGLTPISSSPLMLGDAFIHLGFSLLASIAVYLLYQFFYAVRHIGAGVHRTFLIGGPAITMLFLTIQTSIPLSLGLLGALSFVRFRTPVKDPAEIGFLLLLIATSIGAATGYYLVTAMLLVLATAVLGAQWLIHNRVSLFERGHLIISVDQQSFDALEKRLTPFLTQRLRDVSLETMSSMDGRVGLHYQYRRQSDINWPAFTSELNRLAGPTEVEVFVG
ncbi:MAG: DUF4956 domain-containing protein [Chloroflexota bacterium]|nr:MAG: DUF4956 domain-containing protein [Chloroflexota bacterium]